MWNKFVEIFWNEFIPGFCKVEMLCYAGEPNWLGWIVLAFVGLVVLVVLTIIIALVALVIERITGYEFT